MVNLKQLESGLLWSSEMEMVAVESKTVAESEAIQRGPERCCGTKGYVEGSRAIAKGRCEDQERLSRADAKEGGKSDNTLRQVEKSGSLITTRYGR